MIHFKMRDPMVFNMRYAKPDINNAYWQECKVDVCPQSKSKTIKLRKLRNNNQPALLSVTKKPCHQSI